MKYERVLTEVFRKPWAILPEIFKVIGELIAMRASGERLDEEEIQSRLAPARQHAAVRGVADSYGSIAVIPIYGVISQRMNLMSQISGGTSVEKLTAQFRKALADSTVKAIVFDVDSPGGGVEGIPELADEIYKARGQKKTVAVANSMAASAAYWLAASAGELIVVPSGQVGSIGVFCAHEDDSKALEQAGVKMTLISAGKYKTDGNPFEPLSDEARTDLQSKVDAFYGMFVKAVARGRGATPGTVRGGFGQGRMVLAQEALNEGMVDRVETLDQTLARLGGSAPANRMTAESASPKLAGISDDPAQCQCDCDACVGGVGSGNCALCSDLSCVDPACAAAGCPNQAASSQPKQKSVAELRRDLDFF